MGAGGWAKWVRMSGEIGSEKLEAEFRYGVEKVAEKMPRSPQT